MKACFETDRTRVLMMILMTWKLVRTGPLGGLYIPVMSWAPNGPARLAALWAFGLEI